MQYHGHDRRLGCGHLLSFVRSGRGHFQSIHAKICSANLLHSRPRPQQKKLGHFRHLSHHGNGFFLVCGKFRLLTPDMEQFKSAFFSFSWIKSIKTLYSMILRQEKVSILQVMTTTTRKSWRPPSRPMRTSANTPCLSRGTKSPSWPWPEKSLSRTIVFSHLKNPAPSPTLPRIKSLSATLVKTSSF